MVCNLLQSRGTWHGSPAQAVRGLLGSDTAGVPQHRPGLTQASKPRQRCVSHVPCMLSWMRSCPAPPPQTCHFFMACGCPEGFDATQRVGWGVKAKEGCPGKKGIRGKPVTFIPLVGRRVGKQQWQAGTQRLCQDLSAPHSYWCWPGPMVGPGKCYAGPSPMPPLGSVPSKLAFTNASTAHRLALSPLHPQWVVAGTRDVAFGSSPSPEEISLPRQSCRSGSSQAHAQQTQVIIRAVPSAHFPALQRVQVMGALSFPFPYGP